MAYTYHPFADVFPLLEGDDFTKLLEDIREHGQREPVILYDGKILDGRNRYRACLKLGIPPRFDHSKASTDDEALRESVSRNLHRRHLTPTQRALAGARLLPLFEAIAREKQSQAGVDFGRGGKLLAPGREALDGPAPTASDNAAEAVGAGARSVQRAKKVLTEAPDLVPALEAGHLQIKAAAQLAKEDRETRDAVMSLVRSGEAKNAGKALRKVKQEALRASLVSTGSDELRVEDIQLQQMDVMDFIASLDDGSVDALLTDPPYNVTDYDWDQYGDVQEFEDWMISWLSALRPKMALQYHGLIFCDAQFSHRMPDVLQRAGWDPLRQCIWHKPNLAKKRSGNKTFLSSYEAFWHVGNYDLILPEQWGPERFDVQRDTVPQSNHVQDPALHPCTKPISLIERLLGVVCPPGGLVIDPFIGSGTTAVAAQRLKMRMKGCDIIKENVHLSMGRLANDGSR